MAYQGQEKTCPSSRPTGRVSEGEGRSSHPSSQHNLPDFTLRTGLGLPALLTCCFLCVPFSTKVVIREIMRSISGIAHAGGRPTAVPGILRRSCDWGRGKRLAESLPFCHIQRGTNSLSDRTLAYHSCGMICGWAGTECYS